MTSTFEKRKFSIIIPIYNAERYIGKCLDSVIKQTYKNIELILIDDGSTDNSAQICKNYAKIDNRIKYYYKYNGGVSSARNVGIKNATGKYITFVDSDDYIAKDTLEVLAKSLNDSDISIIRHEVVLKPADITNREKNNKLYISGKKSINMMLYERGLDNSIWGLAYNRKIAKGLFFKDGVAYGEDLNFKFYLLLNAKIISINSRVGYYYFNRPGSAMNSKFNTKRYDSVLVALEILDYVEKNSRELVDAAKHKVYLESLSVLRSLKKKEDDIRIYNKCVNLVKKYNKEIILNNEAPVRHRLYASFSMLNITLLLYVLNLKNRLKETLL